MMTIQITNNNPEKDIEIQNINSIIEKNEELPLLALNYDENELNEDESLDELIEAYSYVYDQVEQKERIGKILWWADKWSLIFHWRTVTGRQLPTTQVNNINLIKTNYYGNLSESDELELNSAIALFSTMTDEEFDDYFTIEYTSLEEVFVGSDYANEVIQEINENNHIIKCFRKLGIME
jgi:hypothetical protein